MLNTRPSFVSVYNLFSLVATLKRYFEICNTCFTGGLLSSKERIQKEIEEKFAKMPLNISRFFDIDTDTYADKGVVVYGFKDELLDEFVSEFLLPFRRGYISDDELEAGIAEKVWVDKKEGISTQIPAKAHLKSGEFSEILLFYLSHCLRCPDANVAPLKWRWKENQDMPCHLTDIVLIKCDDEMNPKTDDYLYFVESKGKANAPSQNGESVMNAAIEGAENDSVSRAGKTVTYLITKYSKDKEYDKARKVRRFKDSVNVGYLRYSNAAIVVEKESLDHHITKITADNLDRARRNNISLFAVPIDNMKALYERMYNEVVNV